MSKTQDDVGPMVEAGDLFMKMMSEVVEIGNRQMEDAEEEDAEEVDFWEVADGLLAGAVQFWLYAHSPCDDPDCEACAPVSTAALRMKQLLGQVTELAEGSEYYHSPNDADAGHA